MAESAGPTTVLAGSVTSSYLTLEALIRHGLPVAGVLGLSPAKSANVSGYTRLDALAAEAGIPYREFEDLNAPETVEIVRAWAPDVFFIVGLSQMVKRGLLEIPALGCVGFHPTRLPEARGRAPVAWMTLEARSGAATFFKMNDRADAGPILVQEPFPVMPSDYAADVIRKQDAAIAAALDHWLPKLKAGEWKPVPQAEAEATFYGKRAPEDGQIDWDRPAQAIYDLVRAASHPYPGAYTYAGDRRLIVWRAELEPELPWRGVTGRVLHVDALRGGLVQTGAGLLWLAETEFADAEGTAAAMRVGQKLGYAAGDEIFALRDRIRALEARISALEHPNRIGKNK
jgi:methionyl-tRNA formyltransferase